MYSTPYAGTPGTAVDDSSLANPTVDTSCLCVLVKSGIVPGYKDDPIDNWSYVYSGYLSPAE
jgi:hypothetical protein